MVDRMWAPAGDGFLKCRHYVRGPLDLGFSLSVFQGAHGIVFIGFYGPDVRETGCSSDGCDADISKAASGSKR